MALCRLLRWIYTDYMKMPHLMYFTGIVDLMEQALHFTYEDATDVAEPLMWCFSSHTYAA